MPTAATARPPPSRIRTTPPGASWPRAQEETVDLGDGTATTLAHTLDVAGPLTQVLRTSDGREAATFLYGLGRLAAVGSKETRFFAADVRGSPRLLTDGRGAVAGVRGFDAWGVPDPNSSAANESGPAALSELFGFSGERQDASSGLLYLRARWYHPSIGRFLSRDPVAGTRSDPRTAHPHAYALNNPTSFVDRTGRSAASLFDGATGYSYDGTAPYAAYPALASFGGPPNAAPVAARETGGGGPLRYAAQVGGGFLKGAWSTVTGIGQMAQGAWNSTAACAYDRSACDAQWQANRELGSTVQTLGVGGTAGAIWDAATANCGAALATGAAEAVGGCGFDVISTVVGTKGVDKLAKLARATRSATASADVVATSTRVMRSTQASGGAGRISLADAAAAARRNGIDMRMFELRYEAGSGAYGYITQTGSGALVRGQTGRIVIALQDAALRSPIDAVQTIAHELNHVRGILRSGQVTTEAVAEAAAQALAPFFR